MVTALEAMNDGTSGKNFNASLSALMIWENSESPADGDAEAMSKA
jgi:hypothetical protein